ncbi:unnamed protein product [Arctogadus glacialis]
MFDIILKFGRHLCLDIASKGIKSLGRIRERRRDLEMMHTRRWQERFDTMNQVKVNGMSKEDLKKHCNEVHKTLDICGHMDGPEMLQEIINLPQLPPKTSALEMPSS